MLSQSCCLLTLIHIWKHLKWPLFYQLFDLFNWILVSSTCIHIYIHNMHSHLHPHLHPQLHSHLHPRPPVLVALYLRRSSRVFTFTSTSTFIVTTSYNFPLSPPRATTHTYTSTITSPIFHMHLHIHIHYLSFILISLFLLRLVPTPLTSQVQTWVLQIL